MAGENTELEVKFYVTDLRTVAARIWSAGCKLVRPRTHEYNLRFDTPGGDLTRTVQVLRLRRDTTNRMTYKGPGLVVDGVRHRREVEFEVSDFDNARALLEALGYQVCMVYEKYRAVYEIGDLHVTLDEMPFGDFVEVEGPEVASIRAVCPQLRLDWAARINESYAALFQIACQNLGRSIPNLTFEDFAEIEVTTRHLGVHTADIPPSG